MELPDRKERLVDLLLHLFRHGRITLAGALRLFDAEREQHATLRKDLELLASRGAVRVEQRGRENEWILASPVDLGVRGDLDRIALEVGREQVKFLKGTPLEPAGDRAAEGGRPLRWQHLDRKLLVLHEPERSYEAHQDVMEALVDALLREVGVSYAYTSSSGTVTECELAQVLTLVLYRRAVYAIVRAPGLEGTRSLAVERISRVDVSKQPLAYPPAWSPRRAFASLFGVIPTGSAKRTVLRFSREKEALVRARVWHPSQQIRIAEDGRVELEMEVHGKELERFVLEWGEHCEVLRPASLRRSVALALRRAVSRYGDVPEEPGEPGEPGEPEDPFDTFHAHIERPYDV